MNVVNYRNIRNATSHLWYERALSEHLCMALSPLISIQFIKHKVTPNTVTLLMVIIGIIAPLLLMVDNIYVQCISALLFVLWFVFDCSDGEVARFTYTFSEYGRDLDYMSHVSCHSLFIMAMWKIYAYQSEYLFPLTLFFFALMASELFYRMSVLYTVYGDNKGKTITPSYTLKYNILLNITYFPNFVVFFPTLFCISKVLGFNIFPLFLILFTIYIFVKIKGYIRMVINFYRA